MQGTAIERSQNRQRKLDGIVTWYFDHVMESLPLMLQIALLLLGCALSRYLWEVNITVASVVLGVTSFGIIFYLFIVIAGAASETCPYQTPGSHALRYLGPKVHSAPSSIASAFRIIASAFRNAAKKSRVAKTINRNVGLHRPWWSRSNIIPFLKAMVLEFPRALVIDVYHLGQAIIRPLVIDIYDLGRATIRPLAAFVRQVGGASSAPELGSDHQTTVLDLRCISWMLQISLDKTIHLSALKYLMAMAVLPDFDSTLVAACFSVFVGCVHVRDRKVVIIHELEELATVSAMCFFRTLHHLSAMDPTSSVLVDLRQRYITIFPFVPEFGSLPLYPTMAQIHHLFTFRTIPRNYRPSTRGHITVARGMVEAAWVGYQKTQHRKVPRRILRLASDFLSLNPPPPTPATIDCLSIVAIDLGCDVANVGSMILDERCVRISQGAIILTLNQHTNEEIFETDN